MKDAVWVINASPLILLGKLGRTDLLEGWRSAFWCQTPFIVKWQRARVWMALPHLCGGHRRVG